MGATSVSSPVLVHRPAIVFTSGRLTAQRYLLLIIKSQKTSIPPQVSTLDSTLAGWPSTVSLTTNVVFAGLPR